jgi:hypothetical protein
MKLQVILSFAAGLAIGVGACYWTCQVWVPKEAGRPSAAHDDPGLDPFSPAQATIDTGSEAKSAAETRDEYGLLLKDPDDLVQRDMCIAMWYAYESATIDALGRHTGQRFGPVYNVRSPVEILEEELQFMKEFEAKSTELERDVQKNETQKED